MGRCWLFVLAVALLTPAVSGCTDYQDLPVELYVDEDFSELEQEAIADVVAHWNLWAGARYAYGNEIFVIVGTHDDTFNEHDYEDGRHSIYRISEPVPDEQYLQDLYSDSGGVGGYSPLGDAFLVMYKLDDHFANLREEYSRQIAEGEIEAFHVDWYVDNMNYGMVHNTTLHELGHMVGLLHINHRPAVMNSVGPNIYQGVEYLTDADLDAFCLIYDCCCDCSE